jgi:hypothetical protein
VPYNYIDQPPQSIEAINHNLQIIHSLINLKDRTQIQHLQHELINPLKTEIYLEIEGFKRGAESILDSKLRINGNGPGEFTKAIQHIKLSPELADKLEGISHDIKYVEEMLKLEQDFFGEKKKQDGTKKPADIVPITGLIFGRLHMLENELKTVSQHWTPRLSKR